MCESPLPERHGLCRAQRIGAALGEPAARFGRRQPVLEIAADLSEDYVDIGERRIGDTFV